jgi:hypothetical protein
MPTSDNAAVRDLSLWSLSSSSVLLCRQILSYTFSQTARSTASSREARFASRDFLAFFLSDISAALSICCSALGSLSFLIEPALLDGAEPLFDCDMNVSLVSRAERVAMCVLILAEARV